MPLLENFKFGGPAVLRIEAERRAIFMFGEDWRAACSFDADKRYNSAISAKDLALSFNGDSILAWRKQMLHDLDDGSPAFISYRSRGRVSFIEHYANDMRQDPADGSPAVVHYHSDGIVSRIAHFDRNVFFTPPDVRPAQIDFDRNGKISRGYSAENGELTAKQVVEMLKESQVNRVANLLAKVDQSVVPSGMPLPGNCDVSAPGNISKGGR